MESEQKNKTEERGLQSNDVIFLALVLLIATAMTLALGDEGLAENIAIYAYYFLVIGVVIRFFELWLPEDTPQRLSPARKGISVFSVYIKQHGSMYIRNTDIVLKNLYGRLKLYLHVVMLEKRVRISDFKIQHLPELIIMRILEIIYLIKNQYLNLRRLHIVNPGKNITMISDISRNIAIFLSVFLVISLVYGIRIDWWFVNRYLYDLIYAILGSAILYILLRVRF